MTHRMRTLLQLCLALVSASALGAQHPDLGRPYRVRDPALIAGLPTIFHDAVDPHTYHVLPIAYRVKALDGRPQAAVATLPSGRVIVSATLAPFPENLAAEPRYQRLVEEIRAADPRARFLHPVLRQPEVRVVGPAAAWVDGVTIGGGPVVGPSTLQLQLRIPAQHGAKIREDLQRTAGVLGTATFKVRVMSLGQEIEWPVSLAWSIGALP